MREKAKERANATKGCWYKEGVGGAGEGGGGVLDGGDGVIKHDWIAKKCDVFRRQKKQGLDEKRLTCRGSCVMASGTYFSCKRRENLTTKRRIEAFGGECDKVKNLLP